MIVRLKSYYKANSDFRLMLCSILIFSLVICVPISAICFQKSEPDNMEMQVKAAYIYNFTKFITWNSQANGNGKSNQFIIAVAGSDLIADLLDNIAKKQSDNKSIIVKRIRKDFSGVANCDLLFVGAQEQQRLSLILKQVESTNVLTVSDIPEFARQGGMIGFFVKNDKVKIEINLNAANKAGLKISAKLLEVARIFSGEE